MCFSNTKQTGMTVSLIETIQTGNTVLAEKLIANHQFGDIDEQTPKNNGTALYWACCLGYFNLVKMLISYGANINAKTSWKATSLHAACDNNRIEVVRMDILSFVSCVSQIDNRRNWYYKAISEPYHIIFIQDRYLLRCGADLKAQTEHLDSPLHMVAYRGFTLLSRMLVEMGADVNSRNNKNHTPLDSAVQQGQFETASYLRGVSKSGGTCNDSRDLFSVKQNRPMVHRTSLNASTNDNRSVSCTYNFTDASRQLRTGAHHVEMENTPPGNIRVQPETQRRRHIRDIGRQCTYPTHLQFQRDAATQFPSLRTRPQTYSADLMPSSDSFVFNSLQNDLSIDGECSLNSRDLTYRNIPL